MWTFWVGFLRIGWHPKKVRSQSHLHQVVQPALDYSLLRYRDHIPVLDVILKSYARWYEGEIGHLRQAIGGGSYSATNNEPAQSVHCERSGGFSFGKGPRGNHQESGTIIANQTSAQFRQDQIIGTHVSADDQGRGKADQHL
jgi:hypothetical protein